MEKPVIICVDDQREVLTSVVRDLKPFAEWAVIEECESVAEVWDLLDEFDADGVPVGLLVCDHIMPGTNGVDFLADLVKDGRFVHTRKVLLTGQASHKDTIDAVNRARIDYYLEKPWQAEQLQSVCRRLLSEYLFDAGRYSEEFRSFVDPQVLLQRLRLTE